MKKVFWFCGLMIYVSTALAQSVEERLAKAVQQFEKDSQMRHAIMGFAVADARTGEIIFERNAQIGLAPASTLKIITSASAFELLGKDFRYKTELAYNGKLEKASLKSNLHVIGSGDPTFGSWRYNATKDSAILKKWVEALNRQGIRRIEGNLVFSGPFSAAAIPDGWIWQDIGNYYGAGAYGLNWRENQYDLILKSGEKPGDNVSVVSTGSKVLRNGYVNELKTARKGTGDNAYIYFQPYYGKTLLTGTIPANENSFSISGAMNDPSEELRRDALAAFSAASIHFVKPGASTPHQVSQGDEWHNVYTHLSPPFDSINYWFMRRSINLYGEALVKTIAQQETGYGATDSGTRVVKDFWAAKGIDKAALNIIDGSGLSPQNRITAHALVQVLKYAKTRPWYPSFYLSLPTYNGMKLKSGSIGGARAFAGYHTSAQGKEYIVAIIVNNYAGSSGEIVRKMYRVLDELK